MPDKSTLLSAWWAHFQYIFTFDPAHDKTYKMTCVSSKDSDHPGHPPSLIRVFIVRMKKPWVLSYPLSTQWRLWSDWANAQADLSLRWVHRSFCWFWHRDNWWMGKELYIFLVNLWHWIYEQHYNSEDLVFLWEKCKIQESIMSDLWLWSFLLPMMRIPVFGVTDQLRLKSGCSASEAS